MNHQKVYNTIIENAKFENRLKLKKNQEGYIYYEKHHILPRCLNGSDEEENLVLLTAKEHYICHKLLTYIYKGNRKIALAFHKMSFSKKEEYRPSSRDYAYARELINYIPFSEETIKKLSKASKGKNNPMYGVPSPNKGKKLSEKTKQKMREAALGEKNHQWGKKGELSPNWRKEFSEKSLQNMRIAQKKRFSIKENHPQFGKHLSEETKNKIRKSLIKKNI